MNLKKSNMINDTYCHSDERSFILKVVTFDYLNIIQWFLLNEKRKQNTNTDVSCRCYR